MRLANCCGIRAQTRQRFTPKWTSQHCTLWRCLGQEAADEATPKGCSRLLDDAPRVGIQTGQTRGWATGVRLVPGAKTQPSYYRQPGVRMGNPTYTPHTL